MVTYSRSGSSRSYEYVKNNPQEVKFSIVYYWVNYRIDEVLNSIPSLECDVVSDIISLKVDLISVDEVILVGCVGHMNNPSFYLYTAKTYLTLSLYFFNSSNVPSYCINLSGYLKC